MRDDIRTALNGKIEDFLFEFQEDWQKDSGALFQGTPKHIIAESMTAAAASVFDGMGIVAEAARREFKKA